MMDCSGSTDEIQQKYDQLAAPAIGMVPIASFMQLYVSIMTVWVGQNPFLTPLVPKN